jgi:hypothetical protein
MKKAKGADKEKKGMGITMLDDTLKFKGDTDQVWRRLHNEIRRFA